MEKTTKRKREKGILVYVTQEEKDLIICKMAKAHTTKIGWYARKMMIDGQIIVPDYAELKKLTKEISFLSRSMNQIAARVNETGNIYDDDIKDMQKAYNKAIQRLNSITIKFLRGI